MLLTALQYVLDGDDVELASKTNVAEDREEEVECPMGHVYTGVSKHII